MRSASMLCLGAARDQLLHVDGVHQGLFRHHHCLLRGASDADAEHAGRTPAGAHAGQRLQHPVDHRVGRIEHGEAALGLRAAALCGYGYIDCIAFDQFGYHHRGGVVAGVAAGECGVAEQARAQRVVGILPGAANTFIDHLLHGHHAVLGGGFPLDGHADLDEGGDDAGVLADGPVALEAQARVDEDLRDRVLRGVALFELVGAGEVGDVVDRMVEADVLERVRYALNEIVLLDDGHNLLSLG